MSLQTKYRELKWEIEWVRKANYQLEASAAVWKEAFELMATKERRRLQ